MDSFLDNTKDLNIIDYSFNKFDDENALLYCAKNELVKCVRVLLKHGANCEVTKNESMSPLHFAALNCNIELIKLLVEYGADTNKKTKFGRCPIYCLFSKENNKNRIVCLRYLLEHGANTNNTYEKNRIFLILTCSLNYVNETGLLLRYGADLHMKDIDGNTAIMFACSYSNSKCIDILLKYGANLYQNNNDNKNSFNVTKDKTIKNKLLDIFRKDIMSINLPLPDDIIKIIISMTY